MFEKKITKKKVLSKLNIFGSLKKPLQSAVSPQSNRECSKLELNLCISVPLLASVLAATST